MSGDSLLAPDTKRTILITEYTANYHYQKERLTYWLWASHSCSEVGTGNALALGFAAKGLRVFATARSLGSVGNLAEKDIETFVLGATVNDSIKTLNDETKKLTGGKLDIL
jgi:hypothetical protein